MPLYDYKCTSCGRITEVRHGFGAPHEEACPACGGALARVFNAAPIVFKGSGFYINDSRSKAPSSASSEPKTESAPQPAGEAKSEPKTEATEAKSEAKAEPKSDPKDSPKPSSTSGSAA